VAPSFFPREEHNGSHRITAKESFVMAHSKKKLALWMMLGVIISYMHIDFPLEGQGPAQSADTETVIQSEASLSASRKGNEEAEEMNASLSMVSKKKDELFHPIINEAASRHEVDPALVKAIIMAESSYNPRAISKKGAKGLMQLMPLTAESLGVEDAFDPANNIHAGVGYFKRLLNQFDGDVELALAAYNAGSKRVRQYKGVPPFESTQRYIQKVLAYYETYKTRSYQIASNTI
jgi:soluble lytic murein transglycosylase-like protein